MADFKTLLFARAAKVPALAAAASLSLSACVSPVAGPSGLYASLNSCSNAAYSARMSASEDTCSSGEATRLTLSCPPNFMSSSSE